MDTETRSMPTIENWYCVHTDDNPYLAPERRGTSVSGKVYGAGDRFPDGAFITTSYVVNVEGRIVTTRSGSHYYLGTPKVEYVEFCKQHEMHVPTDDCPIKIVK